MKQTHTINLRNLYDFEKHKSVHNIILKSLQLHLKEKTFFHEYPIELNLVILIIYHIYKSLKNIK